MVRAIDPILDVAAISTGVQNVSMATVSVSNPTTPQPGSVLDAQTAMDLSSIRGPSQVQRVPTTPDQTSPRSARRPLSPNILSLEMCTYIVERALHSDLVALSCTSRNFQIAAEARLYAWIELYHSPLAYKMCTLFAKCPRVGRHVRNFYLVSVGYVANDPDTAHANGNGGRRSTPTWRSREYWLAVRAALANMPLLEYLYFTDPAFSNSWILDPVTSPVRLGLQEARLHLSWDHSLLSFLQTQHDLLSLFISTTTESVISPLRLCPGSLPSLMCFEGPLVLVAQLYDCPLTHLKVPAIREDSVAMLPRLLSELHRFKKLRALSVVSVTEDMVLDFMCTVSRCCPQVLYLSHVYYPDEEDLRVRFMQCLMRMTNLMVIELDISAWNPRPQGPHQRMLVLELRMYCPSLRSVIFWAGTERWQWQHQPDLEQMERWRRGSDSVHGSAVGGSTAEVEGGIKSGIAEFDSDVSVDTWKVLWTHQQYPMKSGMWRNM